MRQVTVVKTQELIEMLQRADRGGTIELDGIFQILQRMDKHQEMVKTPFDVADEEAGYIRSGWPPPGRWTENDQTKDVTDVITSQDAGL